ncbi:hypothetical protein C8J56DRAFT_741301, partial [Mycena floridula]
VPANIAFFVGRDHEVEELVLLFSREEANQKRVRIIILGQGGMGKTALAVEVVNHPDIKRYYGERNLVFAGCVQATSVTLLLDILYIALGINRDTRDTLNDILDELRSSQPLLIVLDNFETPLHAAGAREQVEQILRDIEAIPHIALLIIMRGSVAPCEGTQWIKRKIQPLEQSAAYTLYTNIYPEALDDHNLLELLEALGYMPLAVPLMARLGKTTECTAQQLLNSFQTLGIKIFGENQGSDSRHSVDVCIQLSTESPLMQRTDGADTLLVVICMLPSGTTYNTLQSYWAASLLNLPAALQTLIATSLVEYQAGIYAAHPLIRSYVLDQSRVLKNVPELMVQSSCKFLQDHDSEHGHPSYTNHKTAISAIEINLQSILLAVMNTSFEVSSALLTLGWHQCRTRPRLEVIQHAVTLAEKIPDQQLLGKTLDCYATIQYSLDHYYE